MKMMISTTIFNEFKLHAYVDMRLKKKCSEFFFLFFLYLMLYTCYK